MAEIWPQVSDGLKKRTDEYLKQVFAKFKDQGTTMLQSSSLHAALQETKICDFDVDNVSQDEISQQNQRIDFETFKRLATKPSALDQWAQSVPLWQLLSDSIPRKQNVATKVCNRACFQL